MIVADVLTARRQDLRDAIWRHGPEHFGMGTWFDSATAEQFDDDPWNVAGVNIGRCGATACAAGHGALIMHAAGLHVESPCAVAAYFDLPTDTFDTDYWDVVPYGYGNLNDEYIRQLGGGISDAENDRSAEWRTVLAYLDALIKGDQ